MEEHDDVVPSYEEAMNSSKVPPISLVNGMPPNLYPNMQLAPMPSAPMLSAPMQSESMPTAAPMQSSVATIDNPPMPAFVQRIIVGDMAKCRSCHAPLHTRVGYTSTCCTHVSFLLCCIFCFCLCAPFVYCTRCCREPRIYCVNCGEQV